ncbi:hypothetical protein AN639_07090 [Candidatus Epulonipiscium fishelsonii]|uniref:Uncharacterized protein n=1 Tax=Candidatus Epulonipiscium fishelsonii TaxID=77094 RepID=A0ACC8XGE3_9FIRM|nr:hypothetical protein AN639_07090 [Epulopiscium sp. SCG-B05WGA-EpuloA1]ONI42740.1 hypothetical protein AN396_13135 [Epulopiscium sp. SCG-B11WGA-EpuloA1]
MKQLVETIVNELVDNPEEVEVLVNETDYEIFVSIKVNPKEIGKIIGKQGKNINAIRNILKSVNMPTRKKVSLEIIE